MYQINVQLNALCDAPSKVFVKGYCNNFHKEGQTRCFLRVYSTVYTAVTVVEYQNVDNFMFGKKYFIRQFHRWETKAHTFNNLWKHLIMAFQKAIMDESEIKLVEL